MKDTLNVMSAQIRRFTDALDAIINIAANTYATAEFTVTEFLQKMNIIAFPAGVLNVIIF